MVNLLAAQPAIGEREAAREAAKLLKLPGQPSTLEERLRKKFARRRKAETLPAPESKTERKLRVMRAEYAQRDAGLARIKADLPVKEREAISIGLDISDPDLGPLLKEREQEKERLDLIVHGPPDFNAAMFMEQRLSVHEAEAKYRAAEQRHSQVEREVEVLRAIHHYRQVLGLIPRGQRVITQE